MVKVVVSNWISKESDVAGIFFFFDYFAFNVDFKQEANSECTETNHPDLWDIVWAARNKLQNAKLSSPFPSHPPLS
jgi:hypothetical protein